MVCFRENFLKLDIFYKELVSEEIKQQEAFEFLSLVSEIGGFLGLLLGEKQRPMKKINVLLIPRSINADQFFSTLFNAA